ncbi:recombinase family protein [Streptomyces sp. NPDC001714]|uniref:recombinase family protein n=1 Tax=Streptomyces sp. NPDC001714 TaxID=3364603 RepID=UPI0036747BF6
MQRAGLIPVASYARTSEDFRQRDGHGVRHQLRINERTAQQQGCRVVATYADNGRGATRPGVTRPGFDRLIEDLTRGCTADGQEIRGVVCVADDRLYRRPEDLFRFYSALTAREGRAYLDPRGIGDPYTQEGLLQAVRSLEAAVMETQVRSQTIANWHWARAVEGGASQRTAAIRLAGGQDHTAAMWGGAARTHVVRAGGAVSAGLWRTKPWSGWCCPRRRCTPRLRTPCVDAGRAAKWIWMRNAEPSGPFWTAASSVRA